MPFPVVVRYWERAHAPDGLWTMPYLCDQRGRVVLYLAAGPAGKPVGGHLIAQVDLCGLPCDSKVQVVRDTSPAGVTVYGVPNHTLN